MFNYIAGELIEIGQNLAVIDCGGLGYEINTTNNSLSTVTMGQRAKFYIYNYIKEDAFDLYGFTSKSEKRCFELLIGVSGVGPKAALSILSANTPEGLALSIMTGDEKALTHAQGIGKKIAQRVILELKDKLSGSTEDFGISTSAPIAVSLGDKSLTDAIAALGVLGYGATESSAALRGANIDGMATGDIVKLALKNMMK